MKAEFRRELAQQSFEEKIRKVAELLRLSRHVKTQSVREEAQNYPQSGFRNPQFSSPNEVFNGVELSESVLARDWNSPEEDAAWSNL
jgi:hypothetical protein